MFDLEAAKTAVANAEMKLLSAELEVLSSGIPPPLNSQGPRKIHL